jgi:hypothetical protein
VLQQQLLPQRMMPGCGACLLVLQVARAGAGGTAPRHRQGLVAGGALLLLPQQQQEEGQVAGGVAGLQQQQEQQEVEGPQGAGGVVVAQQQLHQKEAAVGVAGREMAVVVLLLAVGVQHVQVNCTMGLSQRRTLG